MESKNGIPQQKAKEENTSQHVRWYHVPSIIYLTASSTKPTSITDIRLDRTPTDDEIDILWDRVRDCLQETPTGSARSAPADSVRSAPADLQRQQQAESKPTINNSSLPPKPPIKQVLHS